MRKPRMSPRVLYRRLAAGMHDRFVRQAKARICLRR